VFGPRFLREAKIGGIRPSKKKELQNMNSQFSYVQLNFRPKIGTDGVLPIKQHETIVEVPKNLALLLCNKLLIAL
jgi:hypothetical protein